MEKMYLIRWYGVWIITRDGTEKGKVWATQFASQAHRWAKDNNIRLVER